MIVTTLSHDAPNVISYINARFSQIFGYSPQEVTGKPSLPVQNFSDDPKAINNFYKTIKEGTPTLFKMRCVRKNGDGFWGKISAVKVRDPVNGEASLVIKSSDISTQIEKLSSAKIANDALKRRNRELEQMATHDDLTGLYNRRFLDIEFNRLCGFHQRHQLSMCVAFIDVDYFKQYNDHYGHIAADNVLKAIAMEMLASFTRLEDVSARYGGDEFVLISSCASNNAATMACLEKFRKNIENLAIPNIASSCSEVITVSIGSYIRIPDRYIGSQEMLRGADKALYQAKQGGRNSVAHYQVGQRT